MGRVADFFREQSIILDGQKKVKMLSLDRQFEDMESERDSLKTENLSLKAQVNPLQREVDRLKNQINSSAAQNARLDEMSEKLLAKLANSDNDTTKDMLITHFQLSKAKGDYHFDILRENNFARLRVVISDSSYWLVTSNGRAYLAKYDLL